ncbi:MAG: hypothetical protein AAF530_20480 [Pseudomonadota bacterium]
MSHRPALFVILLLTFGFLAAREPAHAENLCQKTVRTQLEKEAIPLEDVAGVRFFQQTLGPTPTFRRRDRITGYDAWVKFHSCEGNFVLQLNQWCQFRTSYWKGDCADSLGKGS